MMELPLDPAIPLADTIGFHRELVHSGASITEINCVRKHFSAVKGGRLAMAARGAACFSLLVSDVPPGHLDALASGPTLPDTSTVEQCREILARYKLRERFPASVRQFFDREDLLETPKPGSFAAQSITLLSSDDLANAARRQAEELGFHVVIDNTCDDWEYRRAAHYLLDRLRELRREHPRVCLLSSGEVTVELPSMVVDADGEQHGASGMGGRISTSASMRRVCLNRLTLLRWCCLPAPTVSTAIVRRQARWSINRRFARKRGRICVRRHRVRWKASIPIRC